MWHANMAEWGSLYDVPSRLPHASPQGYTTEVELCHLPPSCLLSSRQARALLKRQLRPTLEHLQDLTHVQ